MRKWTSLVQSAQHQIYISLSHDPFLNLSIEHYLLQKSPSSSTVLFLYINRPCVVIGRNQNPWLEVNLDLLEKSKGTSTPEASSHGLRNVELVRRRSGGGTVFHDEGNVNYSVICPPSAFTRDKHAKMVTRALRTFNDRARVNERHDIVLDGGPLLPPSEMPSEHDMYRTKYTSPLQPLKVSGSAYKMIRNRCLHHGTCLVASPNLSAIGKYLRSPARAYMKARGVESVPSPVGNTLTDENGNGVGRVGFDIKIHTDEFQTQVIKAFADMYSLNRQLIQRFLFQKPSSVSTWNQQDLLADLVGMEALDVQEVADGVEELKSQKWIYGQTPQFTLSSHAIEEDDRERPPSLPDLPSSARVYLKARGGSITETNITLSSSLGVSTEQRVFDNALKGRSIHEMSDFREILPDIAGAGGRQQREQDSRLIDWLNKMFGKTVRSCV